MPSWTVHATVAEPPELLAAFIAHYLKLGAAEIHLCLDRWDDDTLDLLQGFDRIRITLCDDNYWASIRRKRPDDHQGRQILNAQAAFRACQTDWFFFCDADEFLASHQPIEHLLANVSGDLDHVRIPVAERIFQLNAPQKLLFDGALRKPWHAGPDKLQSVYGPIAKYLTAGLSGHIQGKSFVRRGASVLIRIHFPLRSQFDHLGSYFGHPPQGAAFLPKIWLAHFDGLTRLHWRMKLVRQAINRPLAFSNKPLWFRLAAHAAGRRTGLKGPRFRLQSQGRENQITDVMQARGDINQMQDLDRVVALTHIQRKMLRNRHRALIKLPVDPVAALSELRPDLAIDMTAAHFNNRLRHQNPEFCQKIMLPLDP